MYLRRSSVAKSSMVMSVRWPELRSIARRHMASRRMQSVSWRSPRLCMSMVRQMRGSFEMLRHSEQTLWAFLITSIVPTFTNIADTTSRGRSSQFRCSCSTESCDGGWFEHDDEDDASIEAPEKNVVSDWIGFLGGKLACNTCFLRIWRILILFSFDFAFPLFCFWHVCVRGGDLSVLRGLKS